MTPRARALIVIIVAMLLAGTASWFSYNAREEIVIPRLGPAPEFKLVDSTAQPYSSSVLDGKVWLTHFFFTSCPSVCPAVNGRMATVSRIYRDREDLRLVSISVDPTKDQPPVLAEYGKRFGAQPGKWDLLTGDAQEIERLRTIGFKVDGGESIELHSTRVILVDRKGMIRGFYQGTDDDGVRRLIRDTQIVLNEQE